MSEHPGSLPAEADSGPIGQILAYFETVSWIKWERTPHKVTGWIWLIWGGRESVRADWPNLKKNKSVLMLILFHPLLFDFLIWGDCEKKLGWSPTSTVSRSSTVGPGFKPVRTLGDFSLPGPVAFECTYCKSYNNEQSNNESIQKNDILGNQIPDLGRLCTSWWTPNLRIRNCTRLWSPLTRSPSFGLAWRSLTSLHKRRMDAGGGKKVDV